MTRDFDDLVDLAGLTSADEQRLRRVHELLLAAGPPPELTATLLAPPDEPFPPESIQPERSQPAPTLTAPIQTAPIQSREGGSGGSEVGNVVRLPSARRRRRIAALAIAATIAAACFGGGYLVAKQTQPSSIDAVRVVVLHGSVSAGNGAKSSLASLRVGARDHDGNHPMELTVKGLPELTGPRSYYILMLVDALGRPDVLCGYFKVDRGTTSVRFSVPYEITPSTRWAVTALWPGIKWPGHVVMKTI